ncbi:MAG: hypothetical protein CBC12_12885 [Candidatus Puniceispirillum sp. TMED52]|nr:hypothetical protein [SAR116 cluster bacterium]OUU45208.1 MAG: hypothetical protein CBC12_12885 [Candidatus Puniceispirillum sp. TMED52]
MGKEEKPMIGNVMLTTSDLNCAVAFYDQLMQSIRIMPVQGGSDYAALAVQSVPNCTENM